MVGHGQRWGPSPAVFHKDGGVSQKCYRVKRGIIWIFLTVNTSICISLSIYLVGGFNPFEKYYMSQNGNLPQIGLKTAGKQKYLKPSPR